MKKNTHQKRNGSIQKRRRELINGIEPNLETIAMSMGKALKGFEQRLFRKEAAFITRK